MPEALIIVILQMRKQASAGEKGADGSLSTPHPPSIHRSAVHTTGCFVNKSHSGLQAAPEKMAGAADLARRAPTRTALGLGRSGPPSPPGPSSGLEQTPKRGCLCGDLSFCKMGPAAHSSRMLGFPETHWQVPGTCNPPKSGGWEGSFLPHPYAGRPPPQEGTRRKQRSLSSPPASPASPKLSSSSSVLGTTGIPILGPDIAGSGAAEATRR